MIFYHGTTTACGITNALLPPTRTGHCTELGRVNNLDRVFFTRDIGYAEIYAKKAVKRFGGKPVVMVLNTEELDDVKMVQGTPGATIFTASSAKILTQLPIFTPVRHCNAMRAYQ